MMPHPFYATLDTVVATVVTVSSALATWLLMVVSPEHDVDEIRLLLVPLIGALISSGGMIMLNPTPETRRIVIGRAVFSLFLGTVTPQLCALLFTSWATFLAHPVVLLAAGGIGSIFFYALSRPFTERLYVRSRVIADIAVAKAEDALIGRVREEVRTVAADVVDGKIKEAVSSPEAKEAAKEIIRTAAEAASSLKKQSSTQDEIWSTPKP